MKLTLCFVINFITCPLALGCVTDSGRGRSDSSRDRSDCGNRGRPDCGNRGRSVSSRDRSGVKYAGKNNEGREQWEGNLGNVPFDCMTCICQVESNCSIPNPICRGDGPSESCGFYQIKENYWTDGGAIGESWKACAAERQCSEDTIQGYMNRYATETRLKHKPTCEDFSRIHYGGPTGYKRASTLEYWNKVNACLAN